MGVWEVFLSTFDKQLDAKRRIVVPADFRAAVSNGPFDGVFCFASIEADCLEGGGELPEPDSPMPHRTRPCLLLCAVLMVLAGIPILWLSAFFILVIIPAANA